MNRNTITTEMIDELLSKATIETRTEFGKATVVIVQLENGFTIVESSACVDPANYDESLGRENCLKRIKDKLWQLEGYRLQCELSNEKICHRCEFYEKECYVSDSQPAGAECELFYPKERNLK